MRLALEIAIIIVVYMIGYRMGYRDCFEYLKGKLEEHRNESDRK